ncbi:DUF2917 domain-containing protein [Roseateles sp. DAIF2]|uniref:DUF2917 domain-containing protein n=1 Tax=Roseateles sp. DAIF2 TaxID=2714952 RepID=UPI0018A2E0E7|nr:DUF2917 domain-containing protein [Roseateles sp. DAIF2]QPF72924.1 DUF2917 domain-containing protein [Roseateles sp. DAIF2]
MSLSLNHAAVLQLQDGDLHALDAIWLTVLEGRVWVTRAEDPQDHFIGPGGSLRLEPGSLALLGAEGAARVRLAPLVEPTPRPARPPAPGWGRRLRDGLQAALGPAPA